MKSMTEELLKMRRGTAMRVADYSINEPLIWVRDVMEGDVLLWEGVEAEVTGITNIRDRGEVVECLFGLAVETCVKGLLQGIDPPFLQANALVRVIRFKGEKR